MDRVRKLSSQLIILTLCICFQLERRISLTAAAKSSSGAIVESLNRPEDCQIVAAEGDLLSVRFTESISSTDAGMGNAREAMVTLGDTGIIKGWNEALLGACVGEERRLIIPATSVYSELPPSLQSNVNYTYVINIVAINKPVPDNPPIDKLIDLGEEMFMTTMVVVTEETELQEESKEDKDRTDIKDKDTTRGGGGKSQDDDNAGTISLIQALQFIVIPIAVILGLVVVYYLYKLRHPHKRTTFYKVSELDPECAGTA